ncbi:MAG: hypothetical protein GQ573_01585, partial [Gammaproteobacteria bacterium]|nr:hypothetical protein [Gammaproteobacteria bacterium]
TAGEPFATIEATPLAQLDKSREVLLVWRNIPQQDEQKTNENKKKVTDAAAENNSSATADTTTDIDKEKEEENKPVQNGDNSE